MPDICNRGLATYFPYYVTYVSYVVVALFPARLFRGFLERSSDIWTTVGLGAEVWLRNMFIWTQWRFLSPQSNINPQPPSGGWGLIGLGTPLIRNSWWAPQEGTSNGREMMFPTPVAPAAGSVSLGPEVVAHWPGAVG